MKKKRRTPPESGERPARLADDRFSSLRQLKAPRPARREPSPHTPERPPSDEHSASETDGGLFRSVMADATPLEDVNRAQIDTARPAPVPRRPRPEELQPDAAPQGPAAPPPGDDSAWFRHMMHDVTPLADRNQIEDDGTFKPDPGELPPPEQLLDPDDVIGWLSKGTVPLKDSNRIEAEPMPPVPAPRQREADQRAVLDESLDAFTLEDRLDIGEEAVFLRPGIPRRVLADLRRGRWVVQGEIDLHGLTRDEARSALGEFLARSLQKGWRCVRVVHGKGLRSPGKVGILKHLSKGWLAQREEILAFCQARAHEGGGGALRVLLRAADKRTR